ncbi:AbiTii domain-containing protein [Sphingobium chungangianum]
MAGLVEEIQAQALDPAVKVSDLLRKVKVAAVKLKLDDAVDWVDKELGGYMDVDITDLPPYRRGHGTLIQQTPFSRRAMHGDTKMVGALSQVFLKEPISSLENLAASDGTKCSIGLEADLEHSIKKSMGIDNCSFNIDFGKNLVVSAVAVVRDLVLEWSLNLERQGILGEGITFSVEEKQKAAQVAQSITINGNVGSLHNGDVTGHQNRTVVGSTDNSVNSLEINDTFDQLIQAVDSSIGNENDREAILDLVRAMQAAQGTPDYKPLFQRWVGYVAEYATILGPFVPALSSMAG